MITKRKYKKRSPHKILRDKCDTLFSKLIRMAGYCELKGKDNIRCGGVLQCAHIDTRGKHAIRWNPLNAICICQGHHVYYTYHEKAWQALIKEFFPEQYKFVEKHQSDIWDKDIDKVYALLKTLETK